MHRLICPPTTKISTANSHSTRLSCHFGEKGSVRRKKSRVKRERQSLGAPSRFRHSAAPAAPARSRVPRRHFEALVGEFDLERPGGGGGGVVVWRGGGGRARSEARERSLSVAPRGPRPPRFRELSRHPQPPPAQARGTTRGREWLAGVCGRGAARGRGPHARARQSEREAEREGAAHRRSAARSRRCLKPPAPPPAPWRRRRGKIPSQALDVPRPANALGTLWTLCTFLGAR